MADQKNGVGDPTKCSRCKSELDTAGAPKWCRACRAKYQKEYQELRKETIESQGFQAGCHMMQSAIVNYFRQFPSAVFSGAETADMIRKINSEQLGKSIDFK